jgi:hypothetical protein
MAFSKQKIITCVLLAPVIVYIGYHDFYLFSREGEISTAEKAVRDAISGSGRADLEFSRISGYHCNILTQKKLDRKVRTYSCSASAVFADGTAAEVSIQKKEYTKAYYRHGDKSKTPYKIEFTATVLGLGSDVQGRSSISKII